MSAATRGRYRLTEPMHGTAGLGSWLAGHATHTTALVVDANLADAPITARIRQIAEWAGLRVDPLVLDGPGDLSTITTLASRLGGAQAVLAVGGGALLDQTKLAVLLHADPTLATRLSLRHRSGVIVLPPTAEPVLPLAAIPTTVGTGSELSSAACLASFHGKRLIVGPGLQPELAVLDPLATQTLPWELLAEGALEVLFRLGGMYVGDHAELPTEDAFAETLLQRLVTVATDLAALRAAGQPAPEQLRLELAKLSGLSHASWMARPRDPYACKGWYLANELSTGLGLRKMTAAAALLPHLWAAIAKPDPRWGSAHRLHHLWRQIRAAGPRPLPRDPVAGITSLIDAWQIDRRVAAPPERITEITYAALRAWGDGLPALRGLAAPDIEGLLYRAACPHAATTAA